MQDLFGATLGGVSSDSTRATNVVGRWFPHTMELLRLEIAKIGYQGTVPRVMVWFTVSREHNVHPHALIQRVLPDAVPHGIDFPVYRPADIFVC